MAPFSSHLRSPKNQFILDPTRTLFDFHHPKMQLHFIPLLSILGALKAYANPIQVAMTLSLAETMDTDITEPHYHPTRESDSSVRVFESPEFDGDSIGLPQILQI